MPDVPPANSLDGLGQRESGLPLSWRNPARIWTFGSRYDLDNGQIVWNKERLRGGHWVTPDFRMLRAFIRLGSPAASAEDFLAFARAWGTLGLCPHGLPRTHDPSVVPYGVGFPLWIRGDWSCTAGGSTSPEQIEWWRYWARQATALASLVAAVRSERLGQQSDWETLWAHGPWAIGGPWDNDADVIAEIRSDLPGGIEHIALQRESIAGALEAWLRLAAIQVTVNWRSESLKVEVRNRSLFDSIGLLLVFLAGDLEGFVFCHACHTPFVPRRRLGPRDRALYCADCRAEHRPQRDASRRAHRRRAADPAYLAQEAARRRATRARDRGK
jgi:hypothetical protein